MFSISEQGFIQNICKRILDKPFFFIMQETMWKLDEKHFCCVALIACVQTSNSSLLLPHFGNNFHRKFRDHSFWWPSLQEVNISQRYVLSHQWQHTQTTHPGVSWWLVPHSFSSPKKTVISKNHFDSMPTLEEFVRNGQMLCRWLLWKHNHVSSVCSLAQFILHSALLWNDPWK